MTMTAPCPECNQDAQYVGTRKFIVDYHCETHGYFTVSKVQTSGGSKIQ